MSRSGVYRRNTSRRSFVVTRAGRLGAISANLTRGVVVVLFAAIPLLWTAQQGHRTLALGVGATTVSVAWERIRRLRTAVRGWGAKRSASGLPPAVRAAVEDLTRIFGLRRGRVAYLTRPYRKGFHGRLAGMATGLDGAVLMLNDDLVAKARGARPGDETDDQVRAIVAHELAHWYSWDSLLSTLVEAAVVVAWGSAVACAIAMYLGEQDPAAQGFLLWPSVIFLAARACHRGAELRADARAAVTTGNPVALADALLNDLGPARRTWRTWLSTHPATTDRVARLVASSE